MIHAVAPGGRANKKTLSGAQPLSGPNAYQWQRIEADGDVPPPVGVTAIIDEWSHQLRVFASDSLDRV